MTTAILLGVVAFGVSLLTLFAGFGLGTLLLPTFALFFPAEVAVVSTAVVHAINNVFKVALLFRQARRHIILSFGLPAMGAAFFGAALLSVLAFQEPLVSWSFLGRQAIVTPVKATLGALIVGFGMFELVPSLRAFRAPTKSLVVGGVLSGFFGGLSGHQGALRAAFLSPLGLPPVEFAATQAVLGLLVDAVRLVVYGAAFLSSSGAASTQVPTPWGFVAIAVCCALAGTSLGWMLLPRFTLTGLHNVTGALLLMAGVALGIGVA